MSIDVSDFFVLFYCRLQRTFYVLPNPCVLCRKVLSQAMVILFEKYRVKHSRLFQLLYEYLVLFCVENRLQSWLGIAVLLLLKLFLLYLKCIFLYSLVPDLQAYQQISYNRIVPAHSSLSYIEVAVKDLPDYDTMHILGDILLEIW